jgi:hypothetical protein
MAFTTCERCGKAIVAGIACVCAFATIHSADPLCSDALPDRVVLYCTKSVPEPAHGPHRDKPSMPAGAAGGAITVASSTTTVVPSPDTGPGPNRTA